MMEQPELPRMQGLAAHLVAHALDLPLHRLQLPAPSCQLPRQPLALRHRLLPLAPYLLSRGGCQNRWHSLAGCDQRDSMTLPGMYVCIVAAACPPVPCQVDSHMRSADGKNDHAEHNTMVQM
jgi:hypothetical protein